MRIELENTRQEFEEMKTYVKIQNTEQAELFQLVDELNNAIKERDETVTKLTPTAERDSIWAD